MVHLLPHLRATLMPASLSMMTLPPRRTTPGFLGVFPRSPDARIRGGSRHRPGDLPKWIRDLPVSLNGRKGDDRSRGPMAQAGSLPEGRLLPRLTVPLLRERSSPGAVFARAHAERQGAANKPPFTPRLPKRLLRPGLSQEAMISILTDLRERANHGHRRRNFSPRQVWCVVESRFLRAKHLN